MGTGLRIVFFGTPEFAAFILRDLVRHGENIVAAVTTPDKPQGRGRKLKGSAVKEAATELGIPVLTPDKHRDPEFMSALKTLNADVFVVVAYKILPKDVFQIPRLGSFNIHASLLPKYRGAAPINWAIIRGEEETGITTFLLDEKVDTGNMLLTKRTSIGPDETAGELHDELMVIGAEAALETLRGLANGNIHPIEQPSGRVQGEGFPLAPKIFPKDCLVNFAKPRDEVHNFIRGLSPYPGAVTILANDEHLKLLQSTIPIDVPLDLLPGEFLIASLKGRLFVGTSRGALEILELQREGKRTMKTEEFLRGNKGLFDAPIQTVN